MPPVPFHENAISRFNEEIKILVTPNQYFNEICRGRFIEMRIRHTSGAEFRRWLAGSNMSHWPQQLNYAVWCATTGCVIFPETLDEVPEQISSFLMFHIYITISLGWVEFRVSQLFQ